MDKPYRVKDLPTDERPREKLISCGPDALRNYELIAVILGKGSKKEGVLSIARRIIDNYGTKSLSTEKDVKRLAGTLDITELQATQIVASFELGRRFFGKARKDIYLNSPGDVFSYLSNMGKLEKEIMHGLYLDVKNKLKRDEIISVGTVSCSIVHPREVFKPALINSAVGIILVHNHPSGETEPSKDDIALTRKLKKVSEHIEIELLDHIIIGNERYFSMKSNGII